MICERILWVELVDLQYTCCIEKKIICYAFHNLEETHHVDNPLYLYHHVFICFQSSNKFLKKAISSHQQVYSLTIS